jgi:hypothetical protein
VDEEGNERLPEFPTPPEGIARLEHLPTVEASIRYWEAVRVQAIRAGQLALELTAMGLRSSYEAVHQELANAERSQKTSSPPIARRSRLPSAPSRNITTRD